MKHFFNTKAPITDSVNAIMVHMEYEAGHGYVANATPCALSGGMVGIVFDKDYFSKYAPLRCVQFPCSRRSKKTEAIADAWLTADQARAMATVYCAKVRDRCGQVIELL